MKEVVMGAEAAALAAVLARVQVVAAYPITPQTVIVEDLSNYIGRGDLAAEFLAVESEHSAMAACVGASATGSRAFTASSSQGLALMHEMLHHAAGGRLPIVMVNTNRALSPPWNLYCDHTDSLSQRDTGWIRSYCCDAQDVIDGLLIAYKVAEKVMLPVMINLDAFYLTHTSEVVDIPEQAEVDAFLPPYLPPTKVDVDDPSTYGTVCGSDWYASLKYRRQEDMLTVEDVWQAEAEDFAARFGRRRPAVDTYMVEDAEVVIVTLGTADGAARLAVGALREQGLAAGSVRLGLLRPFPSKGLLKAVEGVKRLVVVDRDVSFGAEGIVAQEVKSCLYGRSTAMVHGFVAGIGGVDITMEGLVGMTHQALSRVRAGHVSWRIHLDGSKAMINSIFQNDLVAPGHMGCPGCGASLAMRYVLEVLGPETVVVMPAGCWSTFVGLYPSTTLRVPVMSIPFATTAATASGVRSSLDRQGRREVTVLAWAGDGGTFDIGLQALSGAAERGANIIYICYDNEAYMNTGIQRSSATPPGCWTTTTPFAALKKEPKKNIVEIMAAHKISYTASASVGYPHDLMEKVRKAKDMTGTRFIHLLASCPTGWRYETQLTLEVARKAVECRVFPLFEVFGGVRWVLNPMPVKIPVDEYLDLQGRFKGLTEKGRAEFQEWVDLEWDRIEKKS